MIKIYTEKERQTLYESQQGLFDKKSRLKGLRSDLLNVVYSSANCNETAFKNINVLKKMKVDYDNQLKIIDIELDKIQGLLDLNKKRIKKIRKIYGNY